MIKAPCCGHWLQMLCKFELNVTRQGILRVSRLTCRPLRLISHSSIGSGVCFIIALRRLLDSAATCAA